MTTQPPIETLINRLEKLATHFEGLDSGSGDAQLLREAIVAMDDVSYRKDEASVGNTAVTDMVPAGCTSPAKTSESSTIGHFSDCNIYDESGVKIPGRACTCGGAVEDKTVIPNYISQSDQRREISDNAHWDIERWKKSPWFTGYASVENKGVYKLALAMCDKMATKKAEGYTGWDDEDECPNERLVNLLVKHVPKGDPIDIANFCMMLYFRGVTNFKNYLRPTKPVSGHLEVLKNVLRFADGRCWPEVQVAIDANREILNHVD